MPKPSPNIENAKYMKKLCVYYVEKYKISWTPSRINEPKIETYLLIPILSTSIPEGTLSKAAETYVTMII